MRVALFSDLHLGIYGNSEQWHKVALDWADWIVGDLKSRGLKDIFFLGDFFHNRSEISVQTMHVASEILKKFEDFEMIMIVGNHDAFYKNRSDVHSLGLVQGHANIHVVDKNYETTMDGKDLLFVPWNSEIPNKKYDHIFGHFEIQTFNMNNFKICTHGLKVEDVLKKSPRIYSGHFHHRNTKQFREGTIEYIGNTFQMDFSDMDNVKGYHILDLDGEMVFVENKVSPRFKKVKLSGISSIKEKDIKNNVVKFNVDQEVDDKELDNAKALLMKMLPFQMSVEYSLTKTFESVESVDGFDLEEEMGEFVKGLKLDEQEARVNQIIVS